MMDTDNQPSASGRRVLIVGASGFIGGFIAAESLRRGYDTWCALRESSSRRFLTDSRLKFITLDYDDPEAMARVLASALPAGERWDWVVYNLGATKVANYADFDRINCRYLRDFLSALGEAGMMPRRLLYMSSLSVLGPGDEKGYAPLTGDMVPFPDTRYGVSKLKSETLLEMTPGLDWVILRPTGVYGPHDRDYRMMISCIDHHVDFGAGVMRRQVQTFIYVEDLACAVFDALERGRARTKYIVSEGRGYTQREVSRIIASRLGRRVVVPVRVPLWLLRAVCAVAEKIGVLRMKTSTLNRDKYRIMRRRNWNADATPAREDFGFNPRHDLRAGMDKTVAAYLQEKNKS